MPEIRVEPSSLQTAGAAATRVAERLRTLAAEVSVAVAGVAPGAPAKTAAALPELGRTLAAGADAVAQGVAMLGRNVSVAGSVYEQVDRETMPSGGEAGGTPPGATP